MDFLRIRQKAKERAEARDREPLPAPEPGPEPAGAGGNATAPGDDVARLEELLRTQLAAPPRPADLLAEAVDAAPAASAVPPDADDPLDEFFWREDETAPMLPDLVAASALPAADPPEVRREWLTFRLGDEDYGLEIQHVREVLKAPPLTEVPRAPAHILGVIMVRGEVVAVVDPRALLGLPRGDAGPRARVLVCDAGGAACGVLVDAVSHVIRLAPSSIEARPPGVGAVQADYIAGIGRERNRMFVLLDAVTLLQEALPARAPGVVA